MARERCIYCGGDHPTQLCPKTHDGSSARLRMRCTYCGSRTHYALFCPKTYGGQSMRKRHPNGGFLD